LKKKKKLSSSLKNGPAFYNGGVVVVNSEVVELPFVSFTCVHLVHRLGRLMHDADVETSGVEGGKALLAEPALSMRVRLPRRDFKTCSKTIYVLGPGRAQA
jgi:hypothetical protein